METLKEYGDGEKNSFLGKHNCFAVLQRMQKLCKWMQKHLHIKY